MLIGKSTHSIEKSSNNILSVFDKTLKKLNNCNKVATIEMAKKSKEISKIKSELERLEVVRKRNMRVVNKIENFLNED